MKIQITGRTFEIVTTSGLLNRIELSHRINLRREDGEELRAMLGGDYNRFWRVVMEYLRISHDEQDSMADSITTRELAVLTTAIVRSLADYFRPFNPLLAAMIENFLQTLQAARLALASKIAPDDETEAGHRAALLMDLNEELNKALI
jgi:hypothetical protein